jgi:hypothetical protein
LIQGEAERKTGYLWAIARDDRPWGSGADASGHPKHPGTEVKLAAKLDERAADSGDGLAVLLAEISDGLEVWRQLPR